uniref:inositol hexakisphosphate and diphosphoinositol-pentakisphosphate kinase 2-like isoform X4 n=1 Tax=Myxine glutinosa TaxID=7769 RepID=UPI0035901EFF
MAENISAIDVQNAMDTRDVSKIEQDYAKDNVCEVRVRFCLDNDDKADGDIMDWDSSDGPGDPVMDHGDPSEENQKCADDLDEVGWQIPQGEALETIRSSPWRKDAKTADLASDGSSLPETSAKFFLGEDEDVQDSAADGRNLNADDLYYNDSDDDDDESPPERQIVVGICSMAKKSNSKPMTEILGRLCKFKYIMVVIFEEDVILHHPVEKWPYCDCLVSFHSKDFPLDKAVAYAKLRQPFVINDMDMQYYLQDRREVYRILKEEGIDLPRYAVLNRNPENAPEGCLVEGDDQVEVDGEIFLKPFVEKPVNAEDHNVFIYYPTSAGGGSQRLFRKVGSRSSVYSPESSVRKTGSYIYEEFMPTDGTDVKVYTVGPDYAHAEARKSPALDGKVERDSEGKEVRYPVILNAREKLIARKVCLAFKQTVCGFDLLRASGHSYVCDVNGFSFVKNSMKYYDDCAKILGNIVMRELGSQFHLPWTIPTEAEDIPIVPTTSGTMMELRCVIAVIRHGDRTPKQKMKMEVRHIRFFELFEKYNGLKTGKLKLKRPKQLQEVLDIARQLLSEIGKMNDSEIEENRGKLEQLKTVLEMYGHFSGINRKVQITYLPHGRPRTSSEEDDARREEPSLLLVLKWGGELTPTGRVQAEELGRAFRCMYPGGQGDYAGFPGCGLLRLHSTYRHDLKIYASDEGRVQMTAAAFAKGLLALEGELTPILVQMVKSANMNGLLDSHHDSLSTCQQAVKACLHDILQRDEDFDEQAYSKLASTGSSSVIRSMQAIRNSVRTCDSMYAHIQSLTSQLRQRLEKPTAGEVLLYHGESLELMLRRWAKLEKDFRLKNGRYDISKVPDIYDCVKYDVQHNAALGLLHTQDLYKISKALADVVIPLEYGLTKEEKMDVALGFCQPLIRKIRSDLQRTQDDDTVYKLHPQYALLLYTWYSSGVLSPERHVRTRLYFTSESHVHSLLNLLRYGGLLDEDRHERQWSRAMDYLSNVSELNYMTQIVIMLYEDPNKDPCSEERFHVELHFSPGVRGCEEEMAAPSGSGYRPATQQDRDRETSTKGQDSDDTLPQDEVDHALRPLPSEPIAIHRRSPLSKSKKVCSMEDQLLCARSEPESLDHSWIVPYMLRQRRRSSPVPSPYSGQCLQPLTYCQEVLSETAAYPGTFRRHVLPSHAALKHLPESKLSGLGSQCAGLFSTAVLGGSSSAPNLQDYARSSRKKLIPVQPHDESLCGSPLKRFSVSFARCPSNEIPRELLFLLSQVSADSSLLQHLSQCGEHQKLVKRWSISNLDLLSCLYGGFESYSMVPSICPLETLHNSLSLKQMDAFLTSLADRPAGCFNDGTHCPHASALTSGLEFLPTSQLVSVPPVPHSALASSFTPLHFPYGSKRSWCSSGQSSAVSSAGPSSPSALESQSYFPFGEKMTFTSQAYEDGVHVQRPSFIVSSILCDTQTIPSTCAPVQTTSSTFAPLQATSSPCAPLQTTPSTCCSIQATPSTYFPLQTTPSTCFPLQTTPSTCCSLQATPSTCFPLQTTPSTCFPLQTTPSTCCSLQATPSTCLPLQTTPSTCFPLQTTPSTCCSLETTPSPCAPLQTTPSTCCSIQATPSTYFPLQTTPSTCCSLQATPSTCFPLQATPSTCFPLQTTPSTCCSLQTTPSTCCSIQTTPPTCCSLQATPSTCCSIQATPSTCFPLQTTPPQSDTLQITPSDSWPFQVTPTTHHYDHLT